MIHYTPSSQRTLSLFKTPFDNHLDPENRWVKMEAAVPWDEMAKVFEASMSKGQGRPSVDLRIVLGVLMVKHIENLSDERAIEYIQENIYAQFFVGLSSFQTAPVFVANLLVTIRKRLGESGARRLNDLMINRAAEVKAISHRRKPSDGNCPSEHFGQEVDNEGVEQALDSESPVSTPNRGTLISDATVAPVHIAYPTDSGLLNACRVISEGLIDELYESAKGLWTRKPRTYRRDAKKQFIAFSKKRKKTKKDIKQTVKKQLNYLRRNINTTEVMLDKLASNGLGCPWSYSSYRMYWIIQEIYRQQRCMYEDGRKRIDDRLVSIAQPHIRPIKRGKGGGKDTEFGPKVNASITEGFVRADQIDFNAFNEAGGLIGQIESYRERFGYYPAIVLADRIYWTRENRKYLKDRGIKMGGVPIGRKPKQTKYEKGKDRKQNNKRSEVEGKFGETKERYGMDKLYTRLPATTLAEVSLIFLAVNLVKLVRETAFCLFYTIQNATWGMWKRYFIKYEPNILKYSLRVPKNWHLTLAA